MGDTVGFGAGLGLRVASGRRGPLDSAQLLTLHLQGLCLAAGFVVRLAPLFGEGVELGLFAGLSRGEIRQDSKCLVTL